MGRKQRTFTDKFKAKVTLEAAKGAKTLAGLAGAPVDLRKSFNGLHAIARCELGEAPEALALLFDGVDLRGSRLRPWHER